MLNRLTSVRAVKTSLIFLTGWYVNVMKGKSVAKGFHLEVKEGSLSRSQKTRTPSPFLLKTHQNAKHEKVFSSASDNRLNLHQMSDKRAAFKQTSPCVILRWEPCFAASLHKQRQIP